MSTDKLEFLFVEIVSGAEIGRRLGVSREAVRLWRQRPGFPEPVGRVGRAIAWNWEEVRRWAEERPKQATDRWGERHG
jgi:predicted DNA-binding transcriptional regulator AlpA